MRIDGRQDGELRPIKITRNYIKYAEGSVLIEAGDTRVICTASIDEKVPPFRKETGLGWVTAEYSMIPRSTLQRNQRDISKLRQNGRSHEIQRLIGRALRAVVDFKQLGERQIIIDCDVIQADGGTRTASITGSFIALTDACGVLVKNGLISRMPIVDLVAAASVGIVGGTPMLDLCFEEDSKADVDMNIVMTGNGGFVEIQATAERLPFNDAQYRMMLDFARKGISELILIQKKEIGSLI